MKKGFALLTMIFIMLALSVLVTGVVTLLVSGSRSAIDDYRSDRAFYIAEAGRVFGVKQVFGVDDWTQSGLPLSRAFNGGNFTVSAVNPSANYIEIHSVGIVTFEGKTYRRETSSVLTKSVWGFTSQYVLYWGGGPGDSTTTQVGNDVAVYGDVFVNSNIVFSAGDTAQNVYATGNISGDLSGISGVIEPQASLPSNPPSFDQTYYNNQIATAQGYPAGNQTWSSRTISGDNWINGNLTVNNNSQINVSGSTKVVVTGTVSIGNNVVFGNNLILISQGQITTGNNIEIGDQCIFYSTNGYSIGNDFETGSFLAGAGTSFLTPGNFQSFGNNAEIYGFIYCGGQMSLGNNTQFWGSIVANRLNSIGNNVHLQVNGDLVDYSSIPGLSGGNETKISTWEEVF